MRYAARSLSPIIDLCLRRVNKTLHRDNPPPQVYTVSSGMSAARADVSLAGQIWQSVTRPGREARGSNALQVPRLLLVGASGPALLSPPPYLQPHLKSKTWVSTLLTDRNLVQHSTPRLPMGFLFFLSLSLFCARL